MINLRHLRIRKPILYLLILYSYCPSFRSLIIILVLFRTYDNFFSLHSLFTTLILLKVVFIYNILIK